MGLFMKNNDAENREFDNNQKRLADHGKDIAAIKNELSEIRESIDFMNEQIAAFNESVMSFKDYINVEQKVQTKYLSDIQARVQRINSSVIGMPSVVESVSKIDKIDVIEETVGNIDYNIRNAVSSDGDSEYKQMVSKKLSEYEEDLYKKFLRKYIIDSQISLYTQINQRLRVSDKEDSLKQVLGMIVNQLEAIGIMTHTSKSGDVFNPKSMTSGHYPNQKTENEELDGRVAESVQPMFFWNLPSIRQQSDQMLLKEEEVILYQYVKNEN